MFTSNVQLNIQKDWKNNAHSQQKFIRDERLKFRNYVLALCHELTPSGKNTQLQPKSTRPRINQVYKMSKVYRLAMVIPESTRLITGNYERVWAGRAIEDCPHRYYHPNRNQCFLLALKFKQSYADQINYLKC